jgi:hypothetical protein
VTDHRRGLRESAIEADNYTYARSLRIIFRKLNFGEGWPDRLLLYRGHVLFIEYKQLGEKPTALQEYQHDILRKQGFEVQIVDDKQKGRKLIKEWHDRIDQELAKVLPSTD